MQETLALHKCEKGSILSALGEIVAVEVSSFRNHFQSLNVKSFGI